LVGVFALPHIRPPTAFGRRPTATVGGA
jgi:hypothetical protein